ncbi:ParB-like nuclease domain protein [Microbacterium phage Cressida]|uniref:ParB-like nuclease domain protein n=1 Tax=Microbacterium phage Cressida TaxID=2591216 RepID=A0A514DI99_9CAUD|nr:ParB-like nuclease domain protein [Microbacterium phage Cressida]QDH93338.1 ParB-like nuclease domain protein [Microbacterium phage Cressida]
MTDDARTTQWLPLDDLHPDPRNPRKHDRGMIADSITRFGYIEPIIRDDRTGYIISGHGRALTLRKMREQSQMPPDGVSIDATGQWLVPVTTGWASKDDAEAAGALVVLNRAVENGDWNVDALRGLLDEMRADGGDFTGIGYDPDEVRALLGEAKANDTKRNTTKTPSMTDYAETYEEEGGRLIVLDYTGTEYDDATAGLKTLRERHAAENASGALLAHLEETYGGDE